MSLSLPKCDFCKHYFYDKQNKKDCCHAFPDGITLEAMRADESAVCANGIKFEEES